MDRGLWVRILASRPEQSLGCRGLTADLDGVMDNLWSEYVLTELGCLVDCQFVLEGFIHLTEI